MRSTVSPKQGVVVLEERNTCWAAPEEYVDRLYKNKYTYITLRNVKFRQQKYHHKVHGKGGGSYMSRIYHGLYMVN